MKTAVKSMKQENSFSMRTIAVVIAAAMALLFLWSDVLPAHAAEPFTLYTDTPGINVSAGDNVTFDLYTTSGAAGEDISLSIESLPSGFSAFFKRGSYDVNKVHASGTAEAVASLQVSVPKETTEGNYNISVKAQTPDGISDTLTITLSVTGLESGESNFIVEYPEQEGTTGTSFTYSTTITNNTLNDQTYNFSSNAPSGWTVTFKTTSDSTQVSSVDIESGSNKGITITVTPPDKVEAGDYEIDCSATSTKEQLSNQLKVKILGTYDLDVSTSDGRLSLDAYAEKASDVTLKITNNGNIELTNINLSSSAPAGWDVTFDESVIESLEAGASKEVKVQITPDGDALTGDYVTYISASSDNKSASAEFRITVKTQTGWGVFAIIVIIAVIAGLGYIIKKYGRR